MTNHQESVRITSHGRRQRVSPFWRHFWGMLAAMAVGMIVTGGIFVTVVGLKTWDEVTTQYSTQALIAMAVGMTVPMAAWMLHRRMDGRNTAEMSAVMLLAVVPFLCLVWFDVTKSAQCGAYCLLTIVAMLGLMRYRYAVYAAHEHGQAMAVEESDSGSPPALVTSSAGNTDPGE